MTQGEAVGRVGREDAACLGRLGGHSWGTGAAGGPRSELSGNHMPQLRSYSVKTHKHFSRIAVILRGARHSATIQWLVSQQGLVR